MPKSAVSKIDKKPKSAVRAPTKPKTLYAIAPWSCQHHPDRSEIEAYVMTSGKNEIIAEVRVSAYVNAEATANFIVEAVNDYEKHQNQIDELVATLELCIEGGDLTWEAEQEAELVLRRIKRAI